MTDKPKAAYDIGIVTENKRLNQAYHILQIKIESNRKGRALPGQFYQFKPLTVGKTHPYTGSLLFKPFSVYDCDDETVSFMIKIIGAGTNQIASLIAGDKVALIGPLGRPFDTAAEENCLLISGGIGYAPLNYLKKTLLNQDNRIVWLHGGRTADDIFNADVICTDDGSHGKKGFITNCLPAFLDNTDESKIDRIYCCGPQAMMKVVNEHLHTSDIPAQFSLEEYMACGIGVCCGCSVKRNIANDRLTTGSACTDAEQSYLLVCKDGPVFYREEIDWNE